VPGRLASFYLWCAGNDDIADLVTLARTISWWEDEIVCAVLTGVTNGRSESLNRLAKLEACQDSPGPHVQHRRPRLRGQSDLETARIRQDLPDPVTRAASVRVTMNAHRDPSLVTQSQPAFRQMRMASMRLRAPALLIALDR
jgi:hypothetical protein